MHEWLPYINTLVVAVIASSGFWAWLRNRNVPRTATAKLLMGLAYDKLVTLGLQYIEQGSITRDEMEDFREYLEAYKALGGNGVAERISEEVMRLPLRNHNRYSAINRSRSNVGETNGN